MRHHPSPGSRLHAQYFFTSWLFQGCWAQGAVGSFSHNCRSKQWTQAEQLTVGRQPGSKSPKPGQTCVTLSMDPAFLIPIFYSICQED